jgi:hypothetical protein
MDSAPGIWVGSRSILAGFFDHVNVHNNVGTAPPPRVVAELSRLPVSTGRDTVKLVADSVVSYPGMTFEDYTWTRLSASDTAPITRALFKYAAEEAQTIRNTVYNGSNKYVNGESNGYVGLILYLLNLRINTKERESIQGSVFGPVFLCMCNTICPSGGNLD